MTRILNYHGFCVMALCAILLSCQKEESLNESQNAILLSVNADQNTKYNTFKGPQVEMGSGYTRSWITLSHTGVPLEIGVEMTEAAITSLGEVSGDFVLPLHHKAIDATAFEHIVINWNSHGHPPANVFTVPHFDFHFYTIKNQQRLAIPVYPLAIAAFDNLPPAGYMPASYTPDPGGVPQMGKHWGDRSVVPGTFTKTMTYGSYNGEVNFIEPMITKAVLLSGAAFSLPFAQPSLFAENTYYPQRYNFYINNGKYYVTLSDFVWR